VQGATILIVDDDASIRDLLTEWLGDEGYRPLTAANGREAIAYLEDAGRLPDVMLLDLLMPEVNGYDVLRHLRQNLLHEFPVLIFSAQRPDASILEALDSELRDFVAKPFDLNELSIRMQRLLQRSPRFAATETGQLRIYTLGSLRVYRDEGLLFDESWRNKPAKTIFKLLFTNRGHRYPKDVLAEELWPETDPDVAANRLRVAVHELRKMLGDRGKRGAAPNYIGQQEGAYFFDPSAPYWSDVDAFQEFVDLGCERAETGQHDDALQAFRKAEALYQDDYLRDDPFLEWTISTRERLREAHLNMLSDAAQIYAQRGEPGEAATFCRKILRVEPWREEVYRRLMEYLVLAGRPTEALRAFEDCRRALQAEIESYPSPETIELRDRIAGNNIVRPMAPGH
jgi:two-component SAPR family response regulator